MAITSIDLPLTLTDLCSEEAVTLLLHVVVDDSGNFLLPNLQAVDIDIVLNVLKGPPEPVHSLSQTLQAGHQLTHLITKCFEINVEVFFLLP